MRHRISVLASLLFIFSGSVVFGQAKTPQALDEALLKKWISKTKDVKSLQVGFTQTRKLRTFRKPLTTTGRLYYRAPNSFRWENGTPPKTIMLHSGGKLTLADVEKKRARVVRTDGDNDNRSKYGAYFDMSFPKSYAQFRQNYDVLSIDKVGGVNHVVVSPKNRKMGRGVKSMTFMIDGKSNPRGFSMRFRDGSDMTTMFDSVRANASVPASKFNLSLDGYAVVNK